MGLQAKPLQLNTADAGFDLGRVVVVVAHGHTHAALGNAQIQRLVQALPAVLDQRVQAGHAQVGAAVLHIGGHVGGAHQHHAHLGLVGGQDQLARFFGIFEHLDARGFEQRQGFIKDASFGQGQGDHGVSRRAASRETRAPSRGSE